MGLPPSAYELQTLFGMGDAIQQALVERGHRVRVYTPYGAMLPGMAYLVRRLLENTSNESFLKASHADRAAIDDLLRNPEEIGAMLTRTRQRGEPSPSPAHAELPPFRNEPPADFARGRKPRGDAPARSSRCGLKLGRVLSAFDRRPRDRHREPAAGFGRPEPQLADRGRVALAGVGHAETAVAAARKAFPAWSATPGARPRGRLDRGGRDHAATALRARRLGSLRMRQAVGRGGRRHRRGHRLLRVLRSRDEPPGRAAAPRRARARSTTPSHMPRGVAVVIPPWNFPLAIPTRHDRGGAGRRQHGDPQAGRAVAGHRLAPGQHPPRGRASAGRAQLSCRAWAKRSARPW